MMRWLQRSWLGLRRSCFAAGVLAISLLAYPAAYAEQPPKPTQRILLRDLGFPGYSTPLVHAGASMATVHVLDETHLLFTYSLRALVPRLPDTTGSDQDRVVAAVLVDTSTGKEIARTKWRLHDYARYLWSVGGGVFVLRIGSELAAIAPMRALAAGKDPFSRYALPHRAGQPVLVSGSPDGKTITVEVEQATEPVLGDQDTAGSRRKHYILEFYRLQERSGQDGTLEVNGAGVIGSPVLLRLAMDGDGYLWAEDKQRGKWNVSFYEFRGKEEPLAPVMSSCTPRLSLLSRSQFLVESCRGSEDNPMLASYGFDGHENWEEQFGATLQPPALAVAPPAGRFAMSRLVASSGGTPINGLGGNEPLTQEIRVYQTESGDLLLHVNCLPVIRSAENFDLSPNGDQLVVLGAESLDLYRLPELSAKDRKELAEAQTMTPPAGSGPMLLAHVTRPIKAPETVGASTAVRPQDEPSPSLAPTSSLPGSAVASTGHAAPSQPVEPGMVSPEGEANVRRKPPTLLNPGEVPEFKSKKTEPQ